MQKISRVSGLYPIDEEAFIHRQVISERAEHDYEGGFGEDEDISDLTAARTLGCHSILVEDHYFVEESPDDWAGIAANDNFEDYDAKELAA